MADLDITDMDAIRIDRPDGLVAARIGFLITLYYQNPGKPEQRRRVGAAAAQFLQQFGGPIRWLKQRGDKKPSAVAGVAPIDLAADFAAADPYDELSFYAHSGERERDAGLVMMDIYAPFDAPFPQLGHISVSVGVGMLSQLEPGAIRTLVARLCEAVGPFHGYAGLGIVRNPNPYPAREAEPYVIQMAQQFPGLELDMPIAHAPQLEDGIKGVNWLTILGPEMTERLGGKDALQKKAGADLEVVPVAGGVIIQAGPAPEFGDTTRGVIPQAYRQAAALVRDIQAPFDDVIIDSDIDGLDRRDFTRRWLHRFD